MSVASKKRRKRVKQAMQSSAPVARPQERHTVTTVTVKAVRPTIERKRRGAWAVPHGAGRGEQPMVDMANDVIAVMYLNKMINSRQEQAARTWQELRRAYMAELPDISTYKSCLAGSVPGFDDGEGNPQVIAQYRAIEAKLSTDQRRAILQACDMNQRPQRNQILRDALDVVAG